MWNSQLFLVSSAVATQRLNKLIFCSMKLIFFCSIAIIYIIISALGRLSSRTEEVQDGQIQKPLNWLQNDINWTSNVVKNKDETIGSRW